MDPITPGNRSREPGPESRDSAGGRETPGKQGVSPEVYWRRRVFALAAGLAVLGLLAWAVSGASATHPVAATTSYRNQSQPPATPSGPTAYPSPAASSASLSPSPTPSSSSPSPSASPSPSSSKDPHQQGKPAAAAKRHGARHHAAAGLNAPGDDCPAGDVVVSLAASGSTFDAAAHPHFTVTVVSTASRACQVNVGPRYLTLVIKSGPVREWGSGDCVKGGGTQVATLTRGIPVQHHLTWNRTLSSPGCHLPPSPARPGTYTASASDSGTHSHTIVFLLH